MHETFLYVFISYNVNNFRYDFNNFNEMIIELDK